MTVIQQRPATETTEQPTPYIPDNPHRANVIASGLITIVAAGGVIASHSYAPEHTTVAATGPALALLIFLYFLIRHHLHLEVPPTAGEGQR